MDLSRLPPELQSGERVSAAVTPLLQRFPVIWTAMLVPGNSIGIGLVLQRQPVEWLAVAILCSVLAISLLVGIGISWRFRRTADEVIVREEGLYVRKGVHRGLIRWEDIQSHAVLSWINPPLITLKLRDHEQFGDEISFFGLPVILGFGISKKTKALLALL